MGGILHKKNRTNPARLSLPVLFCLLTFPAAADTVLLDTYSSWRMFSVIKPPAIQSGPENKPVTLKIKWADTPSANGYLLSRGLVYGAYTSVNANDFHDSPFVKQYKIETSPEGHSSALFA